MSDPALGLLMLGLIVVVIMMGFPTAFTLMGLGMFFGFIAFYDPAQLWTDNRVFDLMVQRTYGAMTNDVLISIPLFVLMGYVMERGALVDKMFYSIQLAFRRVPASLAVATLIVCTFWGIASGLVGAVVVLMGVIAFNPMLRAGYDVKLASGVITAGGTLGILIPPSVMIIVYAAVAGQSVVKLYAAAMFPGFFLSFLYLIYIIGWAMINPKIAPPLPEEQTRVPVPAWMRKFQAAYSKQHLRRARCRRCSRRRGRRRSRPDGGASPTGCCSRTLLPRWCRSCWSPARSGWCGGTSSSTSRRPPRPPSTGVQQLGTPGSAAGRPRRPSRGRRAASILVRRHRRRSARCCIVRYYSRLDADRLEVIKLLTSSVMPLGILTVVVLGRHPVRHHDGDRSPPASARPAPSCWPSRRGRSTGSAPRKRCS